MNTLFRAMVPRGAVCALLALVSAASADGRPPAIAYTLRVDPARGVLDVTMHLSGVPRQLLLAMKVHPEYDARYWRFIDSLRVGGPSGGSSAEVVREDSTLWRVTLPRGEGDVSYRVRVQPPGPGLRRSWQTYIRPDGALLNPPDCFLYAPGLARAHVTVRLDLPPGWRVATALPARASPLRRAAFDASALLDSPILVGTFHEWTFPERGTRYHVVYWPLPEATPFDSAALVQELRGLTRVALDLFGRAPTPEYWFLLQDGAGDALEHRGSVTLGLPGARLATDPHAGLPEIAHEFFHTWNLVAIRPAGYNDLSYRPPAPTRGLWLGEGVTLYYADVLLRRAGFAPPAPSRLDHLARLLERYYGSAAVQRVPPERASLAAGRSPAVDPDATGGYYLQGELLAGVLDARLLQATHERRGLDDLMRALFARSRRPGYRGYTSSDLVAVSDSVCGCSLDDFFAREVRGIGPIDPVPELSRLGVRLVVDSLPATDSAGRPLPDLRLGTDFTVPAGTVRLVVSDPASAWARAGLRTGDEIVSLDGVLVQDYAGLQAALRQLRIGDRATVEVRREGLARRLSAAVTGYVRPYVHFVDEAALTQAQRRRRVAWMRGY